MVGLQNDDMRRKTAATIIRIVLQLQGSRASRMMVQAEGDSSCRCWWRLRVRTGNWVWTARDRQARKWLYAQQMMDKCPGSCFGGSMFHGDNQSEARARLFLGPMSVVLVSTAHHSRRAYELP